MHMETGVIFNEAQLLEPFHKEADSGPCRADHTSQHFLTNFWYDERRLPFFPKMSHQQKDARQPFLSRIKEMIDKILLNSNTMGQ